MLDLNLLRLGGRAAQGLFSLIALATVAGGFRSQSLGLTQMLGSHATNFAMLMTYTTMLYGLFALVAVEHLKVASRFAPRIDMIVDGAFAAILFIVGIVLATSDYVAHCSSYGGLLRCGSLTTATVFTFFAMAAFLFTLALPFIAQHQNGGDNEGIPGVVNIENVSPRPYVAISTPNEASKSEVGVKV